MIIEINISKHAPVICWPVENKRHFNRTVKKTKTFQNAAHVPTIQRHNTVLIIV